MAFPSSAVSRRARSGSMGFSLTDTAGRPRVPLLAQHERIVPMRPAVVIVDALVGSPITSAFLTGLAGRRAVRIRALLRSTSGWQVLGTELRAHPESLCEGTRALLESLAEHDVLVAEGVALLAVLEPHLAILGAPSPSLVTLEPDVRALRDRFGLVLFDARPATLEAIARRFP